MAVAEGSNGLPPDRFPVIHLVESCPFEPSMPDRRSLMYALRWTLSFDSRASRDCIRPLWCLAYDRAEMDFGRECEARDICRNDGDD